MAVCSRNSEEMHVESSPALKIYLPAHVKENASPTVKAFERAKGEDVPKERTTSPPAQSRLSLKKPSSASNRSSMEIFRSRKHDHDDDDAKSKHGSISVCDSSSSIYPTTSNDERRLSDKVKKAWRGVTGQKHGDPLEQWMAKHSGGTLREIPAQQFRDPDGH